MGEGVSCIVWEWCGGVGVCMGGGALGAGVLGGESFSALLFTTHSLTCPQQR